MCRSSIDNKRSSNYSEKETFILSFVSFRFVSFSAVCTRSSYYSCLCVTAVRADILKREIGPVSVSNAARRTARIKAAAAAATATRGSLSLSLSLSLWKWSLYATNNNNNNNDT